MASSNVTLILKLPLFTKIAIAQAIFHIESYIMAHMKAIEFFLDLKL